MIRNKRETGFELLRIIAMFLIGAVHVMNYGGMLNNNSGASVIWQNLIYAFFTMSVNVFVLISAYFMTNSKPNIKKIIRLWIQVFSYSAISYLVVCFFAPNSFDLTEFIKCCLPITSKKYWFFTAYFLLYLTSPLLNKILKSSSRKELYTYCIGLLILAWLSDSFPIGDIIPFSAGYSYMWFVCLYMISGTIKLHPIYIKKKYLAITYFSLIIVSWLLSSYVFFVFGYTNPIVILMSVTIFLLFKNINIKNVFLHNSIVFTASLTFGIYLFQESAIKPYLYFKVLGVKTFYNSPYAPLGVLLFALIIFIFGSVIEIIRRYSEKFIIFIFKKIKRRSN